MKVQLKSIDDHFIPHNSQVLDPGGETAENMDRIKELKSMSNPEY